MNILMAQVGSFVPCDKASISVRDCIFARVGAGDCQVSLISHYLKHLDTVMIATLAYFLSWLELRILLLGN